MSVTKNSIRKKLTLNYFKTNKKKILNQRSSEENVVLKKKLNVHKVDIPAEIIIEEGKQKNLNLKMQMFNCCERKT